MTGGGGISPSTMARSWPSPSSSSSRDRSPWPGVAQVNVRLSVVNGWVCVMDPDSQDLAESVNET